jgi:phage shock protein A
MGQEPSKAYQKPASIEDNIIEMKIQSKQLIRAGKKAEKEAGSYQKKAKEALKKNNEESAKMFLMSASQKHK